MTIPDIIIARNCGLVRITYSGDSVNIKANHYPEFGLKGGFKDLLEIDFDKAKSIVAALLYKDLAYNSERMSLERAESYTEFLFDPFSEKDCLCYTNGNWNEYHDSTSGIWTPMTEATFDGGVIISSLGLSLCFWVEDED